MCKNRPLMWLDVTLMWLVLYFPKQGARPLLQNLHNEKSKHVLLVLSLHLHLPYKGIGDILCILHLPPHDDRGVTTSTSVIWGSLWNKYSKSLVYFWKIQGTYWFMPEKSKCETLWLANSQWEGAAIGMTCKPRVWWPVGMWGSLNQLWASWQRTALRDTISERLSGKFRWSQQRFGHQKLALRETSLVSGISTCSLEISRNKYLLRTCRNNPWEKESLCRCISPWWAIWPD